MNPLTVTNGQTPVDFRIIESKYAYYLMGKASAAQTSWYFGSLKRAFAWMRALDITMSEAVPGSHYMWSRDIVQSYKGTRLETAITREPRAVVKNTVA